MNRNDLFKQLECLFAWSEFYAKNQLFDKYAKIQDEIDDFKTKHNLN